MLNIGEFARLGQVSPRMLRHYDQLGLVHPVHVEAATGYRSYAVAQLAVLHRLLALRDLGFTLEQIRPILDDDPPIEQLRGMLRLRQAQLEQAVADDQARLRRVDAHLRALERTHVMPNLDIVVKRTDPIRIAEAVGTAPGFGTENIGPVFMKLVPEVLAHLERNNAKPGINVGYYEEPAEDGTVVVHVGFDIGDQYVTDDGEVRVTELPVIDVASVVHRGSMDDVEADYEALIRWMDDNGYRAGYSRELYLEWDDDDPTRSVTELQMPITR